MNKWLYMTSLMVLVALPATAQNNPLDFQAKEDFLEIVSPIITQGELGIYESLPDHDSRRYFKAIFWYKRDPEPGTTSNPFRRTFFERRQIVNAQFSEGGKPGNQSARGRTYLLLGEPDEVVQKQLPAAGAKPGYEETWTYVKHDMSLRFIYDGRFPQYRLLEEDKWEERFERIRHTLVLDRAEPFRIHEQNLTLPNLGFTKDVENLAAVDKFELDFQVDYSFFRGDDNRTELQVTLTLRDASPRGMDIHLAAYDPYGEKAKEFKKLIEPQNGKTEIFSMAIEPDQYTMVLRLEDKDGRESINRRDLDIPARRGYDPFVSSLLLADELAEVPLYGFLWPKKFVFEEKYFPIRNDFRSFQSDRLYLMQHFYRFSEVPELTYYLDHQMVEARQEKVLVDEDGTIRTVVSIPVAGISAGVHHVSSVYRNSLGSMIVSPVQWQVGLDNGFPSGLIHQAQASNGITLVEPVGNNIAGLNRVIIEPAAGLNIRNMFVYINEKLVLRQDRAPWRVDVDESLYSISGNNKITVIADTDKGLIKVEKELDALRAEVRHGTRLAHVYFNAFDEDLNFVSDLNLDKLTVEVDGKPVKPRNVKKVDEPITYCFMVDTSYSMKESFQGNISALKKLIQSMRPQDKGYFVTFNNNYSKYLEPNRSKSVLLAVADSLKLQKANPKFADRLYQENETFLYDAVISAIHTQIQNAGRTIIVLVSDGIGAEGHYSRNGMLSYARENDVVIYSLWLDNNPKLSEEEKNMLAREMGGGEKFARKIGLSRYFSKKDARKVVAGNKVRNESITQGILKIVSEESGGFHYRIFRADRSVIKQYVGDIERAVNTQYVATLNLPISREDHLVDVFYEDDAISVRNKSKVKVSKTNPLLE